MELVSEKLYKLYNREDEIKRLIERDNKKLNICNDKLQKLYDAKLSIYKFLKGYGLLAEVIENLSSTGIGEVAMLAVEAGVKKKLKNKRIEINKMMITILRTKKKLKAELISLDEELISVREEIRNT